MPIFAQMNWIAHIIGNVAAAVHSGASPSEAPACAYVPIPEGSSSDAPVTRPGPRTRRNRRTGFFSRATLASSDSAGGWLIPPVYGPGCENLKWLCRQHPELTKQSGLVEHAEKRRHLAARDVEHDRRLDRHLPSRRRDAEERAGVRALEDEPHEDAILGREHLFNPVVDVGKSRIEAFGKSFVAGARHRRVAA